MHCEIYFKATTECAKAVLLANHNNEQWRIQEKEKGVPKSEAQNVWRTPINCPNKMCQWLI